ncbi:MAG: Hpt domain-containing protein [Saprospiraceae bacterium]|nr:Hpt domain-containing protein [Saprospiraceae bacterium]
MDFKLDYLIDLLGDYDAIHDMMRLFIHQVPEDIAMLESGIEREDIEAVRIYSHKIKSSLAMFQVEALRVLMEKIEHLSRNKGSMLEISELYEQTRPLVENVQNEMQEYLSTHC